MTALAYIARGDSPEDFSVTIPSPLAGVSAAAWSCFVRALTVQGVGAATSDGLGCFAARPRRLGDLGIMTNLRRKRDESGRQIWEGDFVLPLTKEIFLSNYLVQYNVLVQSVQSHAREVRTALRQDMSQSGALAILHCAGPGALRSWTKGPRFEHTVDLFNRANRIF